MSRNVACIAVGSLAILCLSLGCADKTLQFWSEFKLPDKEYAPYANGGATLIVGVGAVVTAIWSVRTARSVYKLQEEGRASPFRIELYKVMAPAILELKAGIAAYRESKLHPNPILTGMEQNRRQEKLAIMNILYNNDIILPKGVVDSAVEYIVKLRDDVSLTYEECDPLYHEFVSACRTALGTELLSNGILDTIMNQRNPNG